jgi:hypothetical protein
MLLALLAKTWKPSLKPVRSIRQARPAPGAFFAPGLERHEELVLLTSNT